MNLPFSSAYTQKLCTEIVYHVIVHVEIEKKNHKQSVAEFSNSFAGGE